MHIVLCLDYSPFTQRVLGVMHDMANALKDCRITVVHVIDETLLGDAGGNNSQFLEDLEHDSNELKKMCVATLGDALTYVEETGIPRSKIDEILRHTDFDLLAIGNHSRSFLGSRLMGGLAEHLLHLSSKPVLVVP